jgi:hypothetical protein
VAGFKVITEVPQEKATFDALVMFTSEAKML